MKDVKDPTRVRVNGPLAEYADGFRCELAEHGFAPASATRQLELMANVSRWLADEGLAVGGLTSARVEMFVVARREAGFRGHMHPPARGRRSAISDAHISWTVNLQHSLVSV